MPEYTRMINHLHIRFGSFSWITCKACSKFCHALPALSSQVDYLTLLEPHQIQSFMKWWRARLTKIYIKSYHPRYQGLHSQHILAVPENSSLKKKKDDQYSLYKNSDRKASIQAPTRENWFDIYYPSGL